MCVDINEMIKYVRKEIPYLYNNKNIENVNRQALVEKYIKSTNIITMSSFDIFKVFVLYEYVRIMKDSNIDFITTEFVNQLENKLFNSSIPCCHRDNITSYINYYKRKLLLGYKIKIDYNFLHDLIKGYQWHHQ